MTLNALIKKLQKLEKLAGSRAHVVLDLEAAKEMSVMLPEYSHLCLIDVDYEVIPWRSVDGEIYNKNGSEKVRRVVVFK